MNYLPFDLEAALKNTERVVTVDGKEVNGFHDLRQYGYSGNLPLLGWIGGITWNWSIEQANRELRLKSETVEINVYLYWDKDKQMNMPRFSKLINNDNYELLGEGVATITVNKP